MSDIMHTYNAIRALYPRAKPTLAMCVKARTGNEKSHILLRESPHDGSLAPSLWRFPTTTELKLAPDAPTMLGTATNVAGLTHEQINLATAETDAAEFAVEEVLARWRDGALQLAPFVLGDLLNVRGGALPVTPDICVFGAPSPTLPPATHTNAYFITSGDECFVVDPAATEADAQSALLEAVQAWLQGRKLTAVVLTHHHGDHIGSAATLKAACHAPIWAHQHSQNLLSDLVDTAIDGTLDAAGDILVVHTPGHARGHICLFHKERRWLVCGDMVAGIGTILVDPSGGDMSDYLRSLQTMQDLTPALLLPAHGPCLANAAETLSHYRSHRLWREEKVAAALTETIQTESKLVAHAYDDTPVALHAIATLSMRSHLLKLAYDGRAEQPSPGNWRLA